MIFIPPILSFGKHGKCRIRETRGDTDSRVSTFATYSAVWAAQSVGASLSPSGRDGAYTGGAGVDRGEFLVLTIPWLLCQSRVSGVLSPGEELCK